MVVDQPADPNLLAQLVEVAPEVVDATLEGLAAEYEAEGRGFRLVRVAGGWRYQSHEDQAPYVERYVLSGQSARLSAAALETLAIVAYKQPISRAQVAAIRGVNVDGVMRTLQQRGYIAEVSRDPGPGQASLFGTTPLFLDRLGLDRLDQLPSLGDFVPGADVVELLEAGLRLDAAHAGDAGAGASEQQSDLDAPDDHVDEGDTGGGGGGGGDHDGDATVSGHAIDPADPDG
jgi:segregation and condensation protein B